MKTAAEIAADLQTLESEQASVAALVRSIPELQKAAARATTQHIIGQATVAEVQKAQNRLDEASAALARKSALDVAIAETNDALSWQRGTERREFCQGIDQQFKEEMATYVEQGRTLLATFRRLQALSNQYVGMTNRTLLDNFHRELNLPQVTGSLSGRSNITTGAE